MGLPEFLRRMGRTPVIPSALPADGRSSKDVPNTLTDQTLSYLSYWDGIEPLLPPSYLDQLTRIAIINPDMSQAVSNWVTLGNPGHDVIIEGEPEHIAAAYERINEKARTLAAHTAGIDGLISKYMEQVALTGALSSEDVVQLGSNPGVERVVVIPTAQIRFRLEGNDYVPYQLVEGEQIRLNPVTYRYLASMTIENSPYAKPPMVAALEPILDQRLMKKNLQYIMKKFGLFGLISASVTPPAREMGESDTLYAGRVQAHLKDVLNAFKQNFAEGLAVFPSDIKVERTNITTDAKGIQELFRLNEEQVFSGLGSDPSMHGRTYSTTETYARVVYNLLVRHAQNFQRPIKRRIERTYELDLALAGIPIRNLRLKFHKAHSQDPLTEAKAKQLEWTVLKEKVKSGLIQADEAAREMGHSHWYDSSSVTPGSAALMGVRPASEPLDLHLFRFDSAAQMYRHIPARIAADLAPVKTTIIPFEPPQQRPLARALSAAADSVNPLNEKE